MQDCKAVLVPTYDDHNELIIEALCEDCGWCRELGAVVDPNKLEDMTREHDAQNPIGKMYDTEDGVYVCPLCKDNPKGARWSTPARFLMVAHMKRHATTA